MNPRGGKANELGTPMVSPWSTNPNTTKDRPFVFRGCFLDTFQGPLVAEFVKKEYDFTKAAVLYDKASDYPKGLAEFFKEAWESLNGIGSVVAYESFITKEVDFSSQLNKIINSGAEFMFTPQYYNEVALIVGTNRLLAVIAGVRPKPSNCAAKTVTAFFSALTMSPPAPREQPRNSSIDIKRSMAMFQMMWLL